MFEMFGAWEWTLLGAMMSSAAGIGYVVGWVRCERLEASLSDEFAQRSKMS